MKSYDVVISGAGMVGSLAALAAMKKGFSVLLLEAQSLKTFNPKGRDLRVSAISYQNYQYLKSLEVTESIYKNRINAYSQMQVWDSRSDAKMEFNCAESDSRALGVMMENQHLIFAIQKQLKQHNSVELLDQTQIETIEDRGSNVRLKTNKGEEIKARLLISCEGRNSAIREQIGIQAEIKPYKQKGLVAYIEAEKANNQTAYQVFLDGGPLALLPFGDNLFSIVWTITDEKVGFLTECEPESFVQEIEKNLGESFGEIKLLSQRASFPLSEMAVKQYFKNRVVLCGDSAHAIHPLAGQGVNLGIQDVQSLFQNISKEALKDSDLMLLGLRKYQRRRISAAKETSELMTFINYLFKDDKHIKNPLRAFGFNLINRSPLKNWFLKRAGS